MDLEKKILMKSYYFLITIFYPKQVMSSSIVTNLYFRSEMQQANISVSTLKCDPYDDSVTLDDLDSRLKELNVSKEKLVS